LIIDNRDVKKAKGYEQKIDVADERSSFLRYEVYSGKLIFYKKNRCTSENYKLPDGKVDAIDARLTSKTLIWGSSTHF
jgi:hypothetical protein